MELQSVKYQKELRGFEEGKSKDFVSDARSKNAQFSVTQHDIKFSDEHFDQSSFNIDLLNVDILDSSLNNTGNDDFNQIANLTNQDQDFNLSTALSGGNISNLPNFTEEIWQNVSWWGIVAIFVLLLTALGNILVILAISWERRLQNMTNYFLMSLAVTDLMVAVLVMPFAIVELTIGK